MSRPANTVAIGAFITGALVIFFSLAFYLGGGAFRGNQDYAVMVFNGSVKGLKVGAPVAFKGVQIGEVTDIDLIVDTDSYNVIMPVTVRINDKRIQKTGSNMDENSTTHLLKRGMRAQLRTQSLLTGLLFVQLDFHPNSEVNYYGYESELERIPTIPTDLEKFTRNLDQIDFGSLVQSVEDSIAGLDKIINDPQMQSMPTNINTSLAAISELSNRLKTEVDTLSPGINSLVSSSDDAVQQFNKELPILSADARKTLEQLNATLVTAQTALDSVDYVLSDDSAVLYDIRQAAKELGAAGRALQSLAETLETQPESLLKGKSPLGIN
jgi:paraquat-inducible protein B